MPDTDTVEYDVKMKVEGDCLRYFISGQRSLKAAYQMWQQIYRDCEKHNISKVHATVLLTGQIDKMEVPLLIHKLVELNNSRPITCAWVDHNAKSYLDNLIGETIPRPDDMNIRIFNNEQDALRWLGESD